MRYRLSVILATLFILSACASVPTKQFVHVNPDFESKISRISHVSVIADACFMRDVLGDNDYWVIQESRSTENYMLNASKTYLAGKGYDVIYAQAPFVGAFKNREKPFKVCDKSGGEVMDKNPPLFESEGLADNPAYREALLEIIPKIPVQCRKSNLPDTCCANAEMKDYMNVIAKTGGGEATLFLIGHGTIVSAGKQITQGVATGLLTGVLTLGIVSVSVYDVSFMDTYAVLIDNSTGEILWSNSMRLKGDGFTDKAYYAMEKWPKTILYHLPSKIQGNGEGLPANNENPAPATETAAHESLSK